MNGFVDRDFVGVSFPFGGVHLGVVDEAGQRAHDQTVVLDGAAKVEVGHAQDVCKHNTHEIVNKTYHTSPEIFFCRQSCCKNSKIKFPAFFGILFLARKTAKF